MGPIPRVTRCGEWAARSLRDEGNIVTAPGEADMDAG
jgi:hypothetical protein